MHDVFYFTDIHGRADLFDRIISFCEQQDPEYTLIFGGDAADRGPKGYYIMNALLNNPHVVYLKGNHEDLFVKAARAIIGHFSMTDETYKIIHSVTDQIEAEDIIETIAMQDKAVSLYLMNGGMPTLLDWLLAGANADFVDRIEQLPICYQYNEYDFCHAGGGPFTFNEVLTAEYNGKTPPASSVDICIWDRGCLNLGWTPNRICVHGHTPSPYLPVYMYGGREKSFENAHPASWIGQADKEKYNGLKIDMDTGAVFNGNAYILNILTKQLYRFSDLPKSLIEEYKFMEDNKYGEQTYSLHHVRSIGVREDHLGA